MSVQNPAILADLISTFYKLGIVGRVAKQGHSRPQLKTQNTQQPTEPPSPYPLAVLSSHSMGRSAAPTTHVAVASHGPMLGALSLVWWRQRWLAYLEGAKQHTLKNREETVPWP